jgi:uncharacterized membrane protein
MMTGLMVWVPLIITLWLSWVVITKVTTFIPGVMQYLGKDLLAKWFGVLSFLEEFQYEEETWWVTLVGILLVVLLFFCTGILTRYLAIRKVIGIGEKLVAMIPGINRVYLAVQQIRDVFVNRGGAVFQRVVLVEYPRPGLLVVGFVTSEEQGIVQKSAKKKLTAIFVPTTPNPTSGFLLYVPPEELTPMDISVEDAMKLIVSGGAYLPGKGGSAEGQLEINDSEI